ncbi:carbohydrate binding family 9 domain-containing protein [Flavobacteriales bacterium]|nr:carbohydrate binding family 9 domain-containing protein [Flavobacteriales bacterium]
MKRTILFITIILSPIFLFSQKEKPSITNRKISEEIKIDGELNEPIWQQLEVAKDFYISQPVDSGYAKSKTETRICYDDKNIYVSAICYDNIEGDYIIQSLKRDFSYPRTDAFSFILEPFDDYTNGFSFAVNPYGVQREGLIQGGGNFGVTTSWDNIWYCKVTRQKDKWIVEMAIPFTSIRFNEGNTKWNVNFTRNDLKRNESSSWAAVPRNFNIAALNFCGIMNWDFPTKKAGRNVAIIPYVSGSVNKNYENKSEANLGYNTGVDAKIGLSSSLQLDLTVNPDFSQVEVDRQVTNLSRFSLFFPERRNFFIENSDLFGSFGFSQIRPFFSRRIGLDKGKIIPIIGGARLSGKIGQDWRIGVMNIQTEGQLNSAPQNFTVAAVQRKVMKNSNIGIIAMNRQGFNDKQVNYSDYNRILGVDFNYVSPKSDWIGKAFSHHSFSPNQQKNSFTNATFLRYSNQKLRVMWNHEYVGENYTATEGFVPRQTRQNPDLGVFEKNTFWRLEPEIAYKFYSKKENAKLTYHQTSLYLNHYMDDKFNNTDYQLVYNHSFIFNNTSELSASIRQNYTQLLFDTDVSYTGKTALETGDYHYSNFKINHTTNQRKKFVLASSFLYGKYFNGSRLNYGADISYRLQPYGKFSLNFSQNHFYLPHLDKQVDLTLIGAEAELSFTKSIFFTTFFQYNTQIKNFNINSRLQWRFKPMSDLFLVYSENYLTDNLSVKNRGLVLKFVYWFQ